MPIRLPAHFSAGTVADETRVALSRWNNQKSRHGIHAVAQALPPLEDAIDGDSHVMRQRRFGARVCVYKVDGAGASRGEDAKIIALRKQRIEGPKRVPPWIVAAGDVRFQAEYSS